MVTDPRWGLFNLVLEPPFRTRRDKKFRGVHSECTLWSHLFMIFPVLQQKTDNFHDIASVLVQLINLLLPIITCPPSLKLVNSHKILL